MLSLFEINSVGILGGDDGGQIRFIPQEKVLSEAPQRALLECQNPNAVGGRGWGSI